MVQPAVEPQASGSQFGHSPAGTGLFVTELGRTQGNWKGQNSFVRIALEEGRLLHTILPWNSSPARPPARP